MGVDGLEIQLEQESQGDYLWIVLDPNGLGMALVLITHILISRMQGPAVGIAHFGGQYPPDGRQVFLHSQKAAAR